MPTRRQALFLAWPGRECLYGGAAGGGKTAGMLAGALQFATVPGYSALLLRRTFPELALPESLIPLSHEWLQGTDAAWNGIEHQWRFPSGATLNFGYLQTEVDKYRYQSSAFQYIGFDELTGFLANQYRYLFSRLRKKVDVNVPLRMRAGSNPGGVGHEWVKQRFIDSQSPGRLFIPADLEDNPYLDRESYESSLAELDPVTRAQLRHGDWTVRPEGNLFKRDWFTFTDADRVPPLEDAVRCWDLAATAPEEGEDPDYVVGLKMGYANGTYYLLHVARDRITPEGVERLILRTAQADGQRVKVRIEQEGAASGKIVRHHFLRMLEAFDARFTPVPRNSKFTRAGPFSAACERGDVRVIRGVWNEAFLDELCAFPQEGVHDDQVDAASGAYAQLTGDPRPWAKPDIETVFTGGRWAAPPVKSPQELLLERLRGRN